MIMNGRKKEPRDMPPWLCVEGIMNGFQIRPTEHYPADEFLAFSAGKRFMRSHAIPGFAFLLWSGTPQAGPGAIEVDDDGVLAQGAVQHLGSGALRPFVVEAHGCCLQVSKSEHLCGVDGGSGQGILL